jgi:hypothetical protein
MNAAAVGRRMAGERQRAKPASTAARWGSHVRGFGASMEKSKRFPPGNWGCRGRRGERRNRRGLIDNLFERSLDPAVPSHFVDDPKAFSKAIRASFARDVAIRRCRIHKARHIMERLPKSTHAEIRRVLRQTWKMGDATRSNSSCAISRGGWKRTGEASLHRYSRGSTRCSPSQCGRCQSGGASHEIVRLRMLTASHELGRSRRRLLRTPQRRFLG